MTKTLCLAFSRNADIVGAPRIVVLGEVEFVQISFRAADEDILHTVARLDKEVRAWRQQPADLRHRVHDNRRLRDPRE